MIHRDHFAKSRTSKSSFSKRAKVQESGQSAWVGSTTSLWSCVLPSRNKEQELHPEDWALLHSHEGLELASETESVPQKTQNVGINMYLASMLQFLFCAWVLIGTFWIKKKKERNVTQTNKRKAQIRMKTAISYLVPLGDITDWSQFFCSWHWTWVWLLHLQTLLSTLH